MTTLMDCIEKIPLKLEEIEKKCDVRFSSLLKYLEGKDEINEIILVASGTSYNSAFTIKSFSENICGLRTTLIYPNIFVNYTNNLNKKALYVMISQGGSTRLVYEALEKVKKAGCLNCSITANLDCIIANHADVAIEMGCGQEEYNYRTLGYSTTVATLYMMCIKISKYYNKLSEEKVEELILDFGKLYCSLEEIKEKTLTWYYKNKFSLMKRTKMMIAGTNDLLAVAQEADIKVMEMVPMITRSFELEEFIHGPQNSFDDDTTFFILSRKGEDDEKAKSIAKFIKNEIGFCALIGNNGIEERDLDINPVSKYFSTLEFVTPIQIIAFKLADDHGRDLNRGINTTITNYITKTI
ncbi:SIS domain-containing protein [Clostridium algidicarnis]|uniref:SIS domain-containing protein n=1 Tax=Clostridium algidicarnis TaxID=37659 RepID=UPI001627BD92|nr:SIS domain-containing protein [Clostridium algidicarnis]MBB6696523.1 SIS domain-containing protein [Clostridium algidicarnis]MBU3205850.1 SIS domain-containing protein [Clostridium algidicarnis]